MASFLLRGALALLKLLTKVKSFLPAGIAGLFVIVNFFIDLYTKGVSLAFENLSTRLFASELAINTQVGLAVENSPEYGLLGLLTIISSVLIIYVFVKYVGKLFEKIAGAQASWGSYLMALMFLAVLEISVIKIVEGSFGFVPIVDGLWYLFANLTPVLVNALPFIG